MLFNYIGHYYTWANGKFRETISGLKKEIFDWKDKNIQRSMRDVIIHMVTYSDYYTRQQEEVTKRVEEMKTMSVFDLMQRWKETDEEFAEKIHNEVGDKHELRLSEDQTVEISKEEMIFAYTDHSTMHRGQLLSLLRLFASKGVGSDYYSYLIMKYS